MSQAGNAARPPVSERFFAALPMRPGWTGALLGLGLIAVLVAMAWVSGDYQTLAVQGEAWWQNRDARLAVLVSALAAAVLTGLHYHAAGTREDLALVARLGTWQQGDVALEGARDRLVIALGLCFPLVLGLVVDRDPGLYLSEGYWYVTKAWTWVLGSATTAGAALLCYRSVRDALHFSNLAERLPRIDLLDPSATAAPFSRQGLRATVPVLLLMTFVALNAGDRDFLLGTAVFGILVSLVGGLALAIPLRGVRNRMHRAKLEELARVHAAIRGEPGALDGSPIARREASLGDLLAWRAQVAAVAEWPLDVSTLRRYGLYLAIPLASWIGGALVERLLDQVLG